MVFVQEIKQRLLLRNDIRVKQDLVDDRFDVCVMDQLLEIVDRVAGMSFETFGGKGSL